MTKINIIIPIIIKLIVINILIQLHHDNNHQFIRKNGKKILKNEELG